MGIKRGQLAKLIGRDPSSITVVFRADTVQSRLVPEIHKALGMPAPATTDASMAPPVSELDAELQAVFAEMDEEGKRHFLHLARRILGKSGD